MRTAILALVLSSAAFAQEAAVRTARVALVEDGLRASDPAAEALAVAVRRNAPEGLEVVFPTELRFRGDGTPESVGQMLDQAQAAPDVDLVVAVGAIGSHLAGRRGVPPVPTLAARVFDPQLQNMPFGPPGSGVEGFAYLTAVVDVTRDLEAYRELVDVASVVVLVPSWIAEPMPEVGDGLVARLESAGVDATSLAVVPGAAEPLGGLTSDVDAALVLPLFDHDDAEFAALVDALCERGLPAFAAVGADDVRRGLFAGLAPGSDDDAVAERGATLALRILAGERAGTLPTSLSDRQRLTINERTAAALGVWPSFSVLAEAALVGDAPEEARLLSLEQAMREAIEVNPSLRAQELVVRAGFEDIVAARSQLRPRIDLGLSWTVIDEDIAALGRAERTLTGSVNAQQVVWSEAAWANLDIQEMVQDSRRADLETLALDVARDAGVAYLDVLRAKTFERIQLTDLALTRSNFELAQVRYDLGVGVPAEVYRWESRIASSRQAVIDARAQLRLAELELNRVLHRPLEEPFLTPDVTLADAALALDEKLTGYLDDPWTFRIFRDFQTARGMALSPELAAIDAGIASQERALLSARRARWQPTLVLDGSLNDVFDAAGVGSQIPAGFANLVPDPEMTTWNASAVASLPLYTGESRRSAIRQARHELIRLRTQRQATSDLIEQRIRAAAHLASSSYVAIGLSGDAAEAARKNLDLVTDSYSRGVVSIIDLLDAQNAALVAEASAANAVYDCGIRLLDMQRAVGSFEAFEDADGRAAWRDALERQVSGE